MPLEQQSELVPEPVVVGADSRGTVIFLAALLITFTGLQGTTPSELAAYAAKGVGLGLCASIALDLSRGIRNLFRADLMALCAFYFLTFFEFLFPQPQFDAIAYSEHVRQAIKLCMWAFAGLAIGRHCFDGRRPSTAFLFPSVPPRAIVWTFWVSLLFGSLYMLASVEFSLSRLYEGLVGPRFSQPWGRGRFGDWKALLYELNMLLFLVPPLGGVLLARRSHYSKAQVFFGLAGVLIVLFYGFCSGTRNLFAGYLLTFLVGHAFASPLLKWRELLVIAGCCAVAMLVATKMMLDFRQIGLKKYLQGDQIEFATTENVFVDYNLYAISRLAERFPAYEDYLGFEVPYMALIRPIPRVLWPGKPQGLSTTIEEAMEAEGLTISATFVGEAYMAGGLAVVIATAMFFGAIGAWWGKLIENDVSDYSVLIYASGFLAIAVSMRSLFVFTTAMLPTIAAIAYGKWWSRRHAQEQNVRFQIEAHQEQ